MKMEFCDLCGKPIHPHSKRRLNGAIRVITMAQDVCIECKEKVERTDWNRVARRELQQSATVGETVDRNALINETFYPQDPAKDNEQKRA